MVYGLMGLFGEAGRYGPTMLNRRAGSVLKGQHPL